MRATAEPLEGNLVRLSVEVDEPEFDRALGDVVRSLAQQVRVPGFRPGKVPRKVLEARMGGAGALRAEALRESLPDFYARAVVDTEVDPIAPPEIDITGGEDGGAVSFDAVVQVRPLVAIPGYDGLQVTLPGLGRQRRGDRAPGRPAARERRRARVGGAARHRRRPGHHRPARQRRQRRRGGRRRRLSLRGRQRHRSSPELDESCTAPRPAPSWPSTRRNPSDPDENVAFRVLVKEVKVKKLPEATDEWAAESSEFDTRRRAAGGHRTTGSAGSS